MNKFFKQQNTYGNRESGFIALISAIIISFLLITIVVALNFSAFFGRFNILDSEIKEVSLGLAEACADIAILELTKNETFNPTSIEEKTFTVGEYKCKIDSISSGGWPKTIQTVASLSGSFTNLKVVLSIPNPVPLVNSWVECPTFVTCP